jgi:hypothetical protein
MRAVPSSSAVRACRKFAPMVLLACTLIACQPDRPSTQSPAYKPHQVPLPLGAIRVPTPLQSAFAKTSSASVFAQLPADHRSGLIVERVSEALPPPPKNLGVVPWFPRALSEDGKRLQIVATTCHQQHPAQLLETPRFVLLRVLGPAENDPGFCGGLLSEVQLADPLGDRPLYAAPGVRLKPPQLRPARHAIMRRSSLRP